MKQITSNVWVETETRGCNFGFVTTTDGIVMIDSPHKPTTAIWLKSEIEKRGLLRYIINTEPHGDHWTGNAFFDAPVIAHEGEEGAEKWLRGVKANLARKPQGNDRAQAKAIHEGVCDIGIANTYYMGKMATNEKKPEQKKWAEAVRVVFLNQGGRGNHINISGAAVTRNAKNQVHAVKLIEFLSGDFAQKIYASQNFEYPAKAEVAIDPLVRSWGDFKADTVSLEKIATLRATASRLVDKVRFNEGPGS
mgnify:CR=1 FL=1